MGALTYYHRPTLKQIINNSQTNALPGQQSHCKGYFPATRNVLRLVLLHYVVTQRVSERYVAQHYESLHVGLKNAALLEKYTTF